MSQSRSNASKLRKIRQVGLLKEVHKSVPKKEKKIKGRMSYSYRTERGRWIHAQREGRRRECWRTQVEDSWRALGQKYTRQEMRWMRGGKMAARSEWLWLWVLWCNGDGWDVLGMWWWYSQDAELSQLISGTVARWRDSLIVSFSLIVRRWRLFRAFVWGDALDHLHTWTCSPFMDGLVPQTGGSYLFNRQLKVAGSLHVCVSLYIWM